MTERNLNNSEILAISHAYDWCSRHASQIPTWMCGAFNYAHDVVNICRIVFIADVQEDLSERINTNEKMIRE